MRCSRNLGEPLRATNIVFRNRIDSIGQVSSAYFTIAVVGKTIDGVPIGEELFVSKSG